MDDRDERAQRAGSRPSGPRNPQNSRPRPDAAPSGGLLSRYSGRSDSETDDDAGNAGDERAPHGAQSAWSAVSGQARRLGENIRRVGDGMRVPRAGEWRATDFDPNTLEQWDRADSAPFELPPNPDDDDSRQYSAPRRAAPPRASGPRRDAPARQGRGQAAGPRSWDDDEWNGDWETGSWDVGWATNYQPNQRGRAPTRDPRYDAPSPRAARPSARRDDPRDNAWRDESRAWDTPDDQYDDYDPDDALWYDDVPNFDAPPSTMTQLSAVAQPIGRVQRVRMLMRRRPGAAALFAFFLLGFLLSCLAPLIPIIRLGYDTADLVRRGTAIQQTLAGGTSSLFNTTKLKETQIQIDGITHDLYEINGAMNIAGAPLAAVSSSMRDYRLLVRMGFDLSAAGDEGLQVAQTLLTPLQGGALSTDSSAPGISIADIQRARVALNDAAARLQDANLAFAALDTHALPKQLQPGSKYYRYLQLLPTAQAALSEMNTLLDSAPALLGIGQPSYFLVIAMDRSELRPAGGFMGNYGILGLDGGKQSKAHPLTLYDTYSIDRDYVKHFHPGSVNPCDTSGPVPQPPQYFWWWPYRYSQGDSVCEIAWGLRDSGLSPDFPTNARNAEQIVEDAGSNIPDHAPLQGVIAFTPVLIERMIAALGGSLYLPTYKITVTPATLEHEIHEHQLGAQQSATGPRKAFTHDLATELLNKIKSLHGGGLRPVLDVVQKALKDKELQVYLNDPHAELILSQLGLASTINTGNADGFFVVDTNDGGNKANIYVTEQQTDYVTLLPDGGALHRLRVAVSYLPTGPVYDGTEHLKDYNDIQRVYMPGDATLFGYAGYNPPYFQSISGANCYPRASTLVTDCGDGPSHVLSAPVTNSDVAGRAMLMGALLVRCGPYDGFVALNNDTETQNCITHPQRHTQTIYIEWYTPHAFTRDASGHGDYTEVIEKQPGSVDTLTVYVNNQSGASHPNTGPALLISDASAYNALIGAQQPLPGFNNTPINSDTTVTFTF